MKIFTEDMAVHLNPQQNPETGRQAAKRLWLKVIPALLCLIIVLGYPHSAAAAQESDSAEGYLEKTGMLAQEIEALDSDARQFIADDLRNSGADWKINRDILPLTRTRSEQYTVAFYINIFAFRAEEGHRIYAVYESSTGIMPAGNDSLFLGVGDGFAPYGYGGAIWYKKAGDRDWIPGGSLAADHRTALGGTFTGRQLGDLQQKMLIKGCVCCHAAEGIGHDSTVTVEYTYDPLKERNETGLYIMIVAVTVVVVLILRRDDR
ncbi:MAG: hypothetical protein NC331_03360 [Lachnospiraceae bacterium]|nr:hypothetical protein [Lachnospiraceae bacterium]MCM1238405.1 hypothetical protein [Lachnospiraceae bacterium]